MTTAPQRQRQRRRINGPGELVQAVPYLLGFHPSDSVVLVGLDREELVVTARVDLSDALRPGLLDQVVGTMAAGCCTSLLVAVYADHLDRREDRSTLDHLAELADDACALADCELLEAMLVGPERWWSLMCDGADCCDPCGTPRDVQTSAFAASATLDGVVALPSRTSLEQDLRPCPAAEAAVLRPLLEAQEREAEGAVLAGREGSRARTLTRALFTAARASQDVPWDGIDDAQVARLGVALGSIGVRDSVWMAIDDRRLDGRPLWRELARRLPSPHDAPALFLYGWASWRAGNGAVAGIAADRAVQSDPQYSAADLLSAAVVNCVDPRRLPRLRIPR